MSFRVTCSTCTFSVEKQKEFPPPGWIHTMKLYKSRNGIDWVQKGFSSVKKRFILPEGYQFTALLYQSGSVIVLGCKSLEEVDAASKVIAHDLKTTPPDGVLVRNVAGSSDLGRRISLSSFYEYMKTNSNCHLSFETELFPAMIITFKDQSYRRNPGLTSQKVLIYPSGKIICTGVKTFDECHLLNEKILLFLKCFRILDKDE